MKKQGWTAGEYLIEAEKEIRAGRSRNAGEFARWALKENRRDDLDRAVFDRLIWIANLFR